MILTRAGKSAVIDQLFSQVVAYYQFRVPYPPEAFEYMRDQCRLDKRSRVLDLGSGPGTVAIPMARMAGSVVALDPCQAMIDAGFAHARAAGLDNIEWLCLRAEDIGEELGQFDAATIGQAFHWMERDQVLQKLARMLEPQRGALILINPGKRRPQESWDAIANRVIDRYLGVRHRHVSMHAEAEHEPALRRSVVFDRFTAREFAMGIDRDVHSIIGYVYSLSTSPRSAFGDRAPQFEQELTRALLAASPSGTFTERVETEVLIATAHAAGKVA